MQQAWLFLFIFKVKMGQNAYSDGILKLAAHPPKNNKGDERHFVEYVSGKIYK